jgi:hypothetical protein
MGTLFWRTSKSKISLKPVLSNFDIVSSNAPTPGKKIFFAPQT